jgi:NAD(P)-dependent dehydrogenase (short-subunit alcohol dehydrogenase family)
MSRNVIVTGAASGIGLACVELLLAQGDRVCAVDLNPVPTETLDAHARAERMIEATTDVSDPAACAAAVAACVERFGKVDALAAVRLAETWSQTNTLANEQSKTASSAELNLAVPDGAGADVLRASTDQGIELVMTKRFDPLTFQTLYTLDTLYGVVMTNPEQCGVLIFNQV